MVFRVSNVAFYFIFNMYNIVHVGMGHRAGQVDFVGVCRTDRSHWYARKNRILHDDDIN